MQTESKVNLNYIEDRRDFCLKVTNGRWDEVLEEISQLNLPENDVVDIHEQVNTALCISLSYNLLRYFTKC